MSSKRLISPCANFGGNHDDVWLDKEALVRRLILFDSLIVQSVRLKELRGLTSLFGVQGVIQLLEAGVLTIYVEALQAAQTGQTAVLEWRQRLGVLPLLSYNVSIIDSANREEYFLKSLEEEIGRLNISRANKLRLAEAVSRSRIQPPSDFKQDFANSYTSDFENNTALIKAAIQGESNRRQLALPDSYSLSVERLNEEGDYRVETSLSDVLDEQTCHQVVERALLAVSGLNQRICEMRSYDALSGILLEDSTLMEAKMQSVLKMADPGSDDRQLARLLELTEMPEIDGRVRIDVDRLLQLRQSEELVLFRDWLSDAGTLSDEEIQDLFGSVRVKIGNALGSTPGRIIRFLVSTGAGAVLAGPPGMVLGIAVGVADSFLLEHVLPVVKPVSFLSRKYRSLFAQNNIDLNEDEFQVR